MSSYTVNAAPAGGYWTLHIPEIGRTTQARNAAEIREMAADLIEIMTEDTQPEIDINFEMTEDVKNHLAKLAEAQQQEAEARRQAAQELRAAAAELHNRQRLTLADTGAVLGVSHQRVHQLLQDA